MRWRLNHLQVDFSVDIFEVTACLKPVESSRRAGNNFTPILGITYQLWHGLCKGWHAMTQMPSGDL